MFLTFALRSSLLLFMTRHTLRSASIVARVVRTYRSMSSLLCSLAPILADTDCIRTAVFSSGVLDVFRASCMLLRCTPVRSVLRVVDRDVALRQVIEVAASDDARRPACPATVSFEKVFMCRKICRSAFNQRRCLTATRLLRFPAAGLRFACVILWRMFARHLPRNSDASFTTSFRARRCG